MKLSIIKSGALRKRKTAEHDYYHYNGRNNSIKGYIKESLRAAGAALLSLSLAVGGLAAAPDGAYAASAGSGSSESDPYDIILSVTGDAKTTMTVTWHDSADVKSAQVLYGTSADLAGAKKAAASRVEIKSGIPVDDAVFSAELTGLAPGAAYYYSIDNGKTRSAVKSFTTAPADSASGAAFMYMGDIQVSRDAQSEYDRWGEFLKRVYKSNPDVSFGLFGGDIVESGVSAKQFGYFLKNASSVFSSIPLMATNGNHESNFPDTGKPELYLDMFSLPQNGPDGFKEEFYSFNYADCHVTVLNSWVFSGEQKLGSGDLDRIKKWIDDDLKTSKVKFSIVVMHHPVYALANDNVSAKVYDEWRPIFEADGVDLVLCGHQHVYARSYPLTAGSIDYSSGVTYVMGMSGQKFYSSADETKQERVVYSAANCQIIRTSGDQLTLTSVDESGNEIDYCTMTARPKPSSAASADNDKKSSIIKPLAALAAFVTGAAGRAA